MSKSSDTPTDEELEESYSDEPQYTITVNGKRYALNEEVREAIQKRAEHEYADNEMFSAWWKVASPDQYAEDEWENTIHDVGDPVLVIETRGPIVPWDNLDQLNVEMQEVQPQSQLDQQMDDADTDPNSSDDDGVRRIDPDKIDDSEKTIGRTHFGMTPRDYEEVPDPDGEEEDKIPHKPEEMDDEPELIYWVPDHPDVEHTWSAGEAITSMYNRVEWNVQKRADDPRVTRDKEDGHDHWESILKSHDCEKVAEVGPSQDIPDGNNEPSGQVKRKGKEQYEDGKYGGNNWNI